MDGRGRVVLVAAATITGVLVSAGGPGPSYSKLPPDCEVSCGWSSPSAPGINGIDLDVSVLDGPALAREVFLLTETQTSGARPQTVSGLGSKASVVFDPGGDPGTALYVLSGNAVIDLDLSTTASQAPGSQRAHQVAALSAMARDVLASLRQA
jgi:hypothetical protein